MKNEIFYFTGTGNSLHISKELAKNLGDAELISISKIAKTEKVCSDADTLGIVFPIYCWNLPNIVKDFIRKLHASKDTYIYAVCNCGASFGGALQLTNDLLKKNGNELSSAFNVIMPDNSIAFPTEQEKIPEFLGAMPKKVSEIADVVIKRRKSDIEGKMFSSIVVGNTMGFICRKVLGFDNMKVDKSRCSGCGLCVKVCPVDNIIIENSIPKWDKRCEMCFACIHYCPKQSISYKRQKSLENYQYIYPEVSIDEIKLR